MRPKIKRGSIKSTKIIRRRIKSIRSTSTVIKIKIEVKIKTKKKRRIEVGIMILVLITQKSTMKRLEVCYLLQLLLDYSFGPEYNGRIVKVMASMALMLSPRTQKSIN